MKKFILLLITFTICLSSCEKDLYDGMTENQHYGELNITQKSFDELISTEKFSNAYSKINKSKSKGTISKTVMEAQYDFTITNPIANVIDLNSKTSYTFEITRNNSVSSNDSFENLLINVDSINQVKAYIVRYFINKDYDSSKRNSPFKGVKYIPIVYNANIKSKVTECLSITYSLCSGDPYDCGGSICGFGEVIVCSGSGGSAGGGFDGTAPSVWEGGDRSNGVGTITFPVYRGGGGGGGGAGGASEAQIVIAGPANVITNLKDYLKCFNLALGATFTIYVDQPTANSSDSWAGTIKNPDPGHTFIAIQQGDIRRVFGYYPRTEVNPITSPSDPSAFGNDQGHTFDVAVKIPINASQLQTIINNSVNSSTSTYNLNSYNCTDFAIKMANLAGLNLPDSYGTWPGGGGSNPGQLGQNIRGMALPANAVRQTTSTNSAPNSGQCN